MRKVTAEIRNGEVKFDFDGFLGDTCQDEEDKIRFLLGRMGVQTDVQSDNRKREAEANSYAEQERN